jgi:hypothetical protein
LSLRWNVVTEAIPLQATLVFGLLRYARNDKKPRWPRRLKRLLALTIHTTFAMRKKTRWPRGSRPLAMTSYTAFAMTIRTTHQSLFVCLAITRIYHYAFSI